MATRLVSATRTASQPTGSVTPPDEDLPQDNLILEFNVIIWVLVAVSGFFFALRAYCKITRQRGLWWDDHVMGAAWVGDSGLTRRLFSTTNALRTYLFC